ncbi:hypothetical protein OESDEN_03848 [Oesophagostomum dentatum]|uniref:Uncharacterized protein n=1 Tax=Oesophagostomum dentatum TaxID=61180 RepID=A0A0B1TG45_OESDE|nr:hypothetical protein OESDEN_03848 [Oesophagostomum dentatum]
MRPNQSVAEFCVALEKLGRKANPESRTEDRSLELAQILLSNLSHWSEHVQLLSALNKVRPEKAYDEVKELALAIEQSRRLFGPLLRHAENSARSGRREFGHISRDCPQRKTQVRQIVRESQKCESKKEHQASSFFVNAPSLGV